MNKVKLTDEELSRVLGEADIGRLDHSTFFPRLEVGICGCVVGVALNVGLYEIPPERACDISRAVEPHMGFGEYPARNATEMLAYLESRGVA